MITQNLHSTNPEARPDLFSVLADRDDAATLAERFEQFHTDNPLVYATLCRLARQWVARTGRPKVGIGALFERARWEISIETSDPDFKLNNNFRAFYARLIMRCEPDLAELFDLRRSVADEWMANQAVAA